MSSLPSYARIVVIGDSLTMGCYASEVTNTWPRVLIHALRGRDNGSAASVLVQGVGGITTGTENGGMLATLQALGIVPQADLLVVELGTNDFANGVTLNQFQSDYSALLEYLVTPAHQPVALVCVGPWEAGPATNGLGAAASEYLSAIQVVAASLASSYPQMAVHTVDIGALAANPDYHGMNTCVDTFHPNDPGHNAIAEAVLAVV